jgi:2,3-bisphosphoglycerate-independent phosphoglycerate mutase
LAQRFVGLWPANTKNGAVDREILYISAMTAHQRPRPVVLCILDGWGHRDEREQNAIKIAETPNYDRMLAECPSSLLDASEYFVGLPDGQMGNSEVGHMNIGAGRRVEQDLPRIDRALADGSFERNGAITNFITRLKASGGSAHVMGLMSPGGVHSHQAHIIALLEILQRAGVPTVLHVFLDGRDTPPRSAAKFLSDFLDRQPDAHFATVTGRYYAMDRDKRWDRVAKAYAAIAEGEGMRATDAPAAIQQGYDAGLSDEFVEPTVIGDYAGLNDGDGVLMANFRADRVRELLLALLNPDFEAFARPHQATLAAAVGMVHYSAELDAFLETLFAPIEMTGTLGETAADAGLRQLRIAETEKYAHVTFFLNGGHEETFDGEERILVPSPKVATYDQQPEMSALEVTERLTTAIASNRFDLIICNYANGDMVGHSGKLDAAVAAVEALDTCLGRLHEAVLAAGGVLIITADHGNCEQMNDPENGEPHTAHTMNPVPFILVGGPAGIDLDNGCLADIAPTVLEILGLPQPQSMTGHSLMHQRARDAAE